MKDRVSGEKVVKCAVCKAASLQHSYAKENINRGKTEKWVKNMVKESRLTVIPKISTVYTKFKFEITLRLAFQYK